MSETMKIMYVGSLPDGSCDHKGVTRNFVKGEVLEWPVDLAKALLEGVDWKTVEENKSKKGGK